ncbi:helix-turn-helix domain-containing protein [Streptomyces sp. NPDC013457]|uniref:helix-turn-helix domain-containing protein n=1 Tax=Streptomyces sp. NPDC013457 TaxID=3364866 RepID=UPI0036FD1690
MGGNQHSHPVTDQTRDDVRRLHAQGLGRNEIARQLKRGPRTISVLAAEMGLSFDRTATEEATRARMADLAEKRSILADALVDDALRLSEQLWQPAVVFNIGGKDNEYTEQAVPEPPALDKRALMAAATAAAAQSLRLVPPTADSGVEDAVSVVGKLGAGLAEIAARIRAEEASGEEAEGGSP